MRNKIIGIVLLVVVAAGSFFGGMEYEKKKSGVGLTAADFQNLTPQQRVQKLQQLGISFGGGNRAGRGGFGGGANGANDFINGQIISKDDKSITVQLGSGGSKIIYLSSSSQIGKTDPGTAADLAVGKTVTVAGTDNSDGSVTAQNIQIRPLPPQTRNQ